MECLFGVRFICRILISMGAMAAAGFIANAAGPAAEFPSTPAGELARKFLLAVNGDEADVRTFVAGHVPMATAYKMTPEKWQQLMLKLQEQSGGLELKKVL